MLTQLKINKIQIYSVAFTVSVLFLIVFLVMPTLSDIKYNSDKILSNKSELVFIDMQSKAIEKFKDDYKVYEPNLIKIDQILVDPKNPISFIEFLELSGRDSNINLNINLINSTNKETLNNLSTITLDINATGGFLNMVKFFEKLEKGSYLVKIKSITMEQSILEGKNNQNSVDAKFLIYVATK